MSYGTHYYHKGVCRMVYKKLTKRRYYETWHQKLRGCDVYIFKLPSLRVEKYHFNVDHHDGKLCYSSLDNNELYQSFDEVCNAADDWVRDNVPVEKL